VVIIRVVVILGAVLWIVRAMGLRLPF